MLLTEFPYPSGNLHIGHWYAFALPDILARYLRMNGKNVLYPIGFDAFGLPAENAAIKNNIHPETWTKKNIAYMTKQLKSMGTTFDWSREVRTIDPDYYKWTQWMFLKFYEKGLAYRASTSVNWCPSCKTVLANEQVIKKQVARDGQQAEVSVCERCETEVEQKELSQWMFRITRFADDLADSLKNLDWQETAKLGQTNWIGRSEGTRIRFKLQLTTHKLPEFIDVFTTRTDTLFGVTAVVISPEVARKWIDSDWEADDEVKKYIKSSLKKTELQRQEGTREKTGVFSGINTVHPLTGEKIPIWIADYVLGHYGTGAVMFVPAHDQRDYDFAKKFNIPIKWVIKSVSGSNPENKAFEDDGILINSDKFSGIESSEARIKITNELEFKKIGNFEKNYRLHDWILSRQRYWGVPIPVIYCDKCPEILNSKYETLNKSQATNSKIQTVEINGKKYAIHLVPEKDLPIELPLLKNFKPADDGRSPLAKAEKWLKVKCPNCGSEAERETDTMDTFVDSSWYFMRYTDPKNKKEFASKKKMNHWLPVPMYLGGAEHTTMHLLYSRFFTKALQSLGYVDFTEPFIGRRNRGIILGPDNQKMSKSRGNVVDPDIEVKKYGADAVRMYLAFMGPYEQGGPWDPQGINGISRFIQRIWKLFENIKISDKQVVVTKNLEIKINQAIKKIGEDIEQLRFNTCISELMKLFNEFEKEPNLSLVSCRLFLLLLAPFAPHLAEEIWINMMKNKTSIHSESWPSFNEEFLEDELIDLVIQINGKLRDAIKVKRDLTEDDVKKIIFEREAVKKYIEGKNIKRFIYIPNRLTNIVI